MRSDPVPPPDLEGDTLPDGYPFRPCTPKFLPDHMVVDAARRAREINPANHPPTHALAALDAALPGILQQIPTPFHLALMTGKNFPPGTTLKVAFLESVPTDLADRILAHFNAWYDNGVNIRFVRETASPEIRVTLRGDGYWSYIGTDILSIPQNQPTMSLQDFSMGTPESEYRRVVRHEIGHSCGYPHEHSRREIVNLLDPNRTIAYFERTQGWSADMIRQQILVPLDEASIRGTPHAEQDSIMAYSFTSECTKTGQPIVGGADLTPDDIAFARSIYPNLTPPTPAPPPGPATPPAASNRVHGYLSPAKTPRKLVVYVPGPDGAPEVGWQYDGAFIPSKNNVQALMFDGPGKRLT